MCLCSHCETCVTMYLQGLYQSSLALPLSCHLPAPTLVVDMVNFFLLALLFSLSSLSDQVRLCPLDLCTHKTSLSPVGLYHANSLASSRRGLHEMYIEYIAVVFVPTTLPALHLLAHLYPLPCQTMLCRSVHLTIAQHCNWTAHFKLLFTLVSMWCDGS